MSDRAAVLEANPVTRAAFAASGAPHGDVALISGVAVVEHRKAVVATVVAALVHVARTTRSDLAVVFDDDPVIPVEASPAQTGDGDARSVRRNHRAEIADLNTVIVIAEQIGNLASRPFHEDRAGRSTDDSASVADRYPDLVVDVHGGEDLVASFAPHRDQAGSGRFDDCAVDQNADKIATVRNELMVRFEGEVAVDRRDTRSGSQ